MRTFLFSPIYHNADSHKIKESADGHVEAALLNLVLDIATVLLAHVAEHFGEHPLERIVLNLTAMRAFGILDGLVAVIADVERGAVEMA